MTLLVFGVPGLQSTSAQAADDKPVAKTLKKKKKKLKKKAPSSPDATSSEAAPADGSAATSTKSVEVLLNAGLAPQPFLGFGATVGMFLGKGDSAIEGSVLVSSGKVDPVSFSTTYFGARYRKSMWSIPYVAAGLGLKSLTAKWNTLSEAQDEEYVSGASSTAVVLDLALGAQMHFGSFAIGADAVGIMYPIAKLSNKETIPEGSYDADDYAVQKDKFDKQNGMSLVLFKVGVGFVF